MVKKVITLKKASASGVYLAEHKKLIVANNSLKGILKLYSALFINMLSIILSVIS